MRLFIMAAAGVLAALILAPTATADTDGYINQLNQTGVPMLSGPFPPIQAGYTACQMIKDGVPPEQVAGQVAGLWSGFLGDRIIAAAQQNLCPETLNVP